MNRQEKNSLHQEQQLVSEFEKQYIALRKKEQRYYTDAEVALLPDVGISHRHHEEWQCRKGSCKRLAKYLRKMKRPLHILEVGCGNGWMASKMAEVENTIVTGMDINGEELRQASRVFKNLGNLTFVCADIRQGALEDQKFDIIIFAASIQYFPSLSEIIQVALAQLSFAGEIHIIDSPLYDDDEAARAKQRTNAYYESLGFTGMSAYYFHHTLRGLEQFKVNIRYDPFSIFRKLKKIRNPFYWIKITSPSIISPRKNQG